MIAAQTLWEFVEFIGEKVCFATFLTYKFDEFPQSLVRNQD
jgi:hypothetical protein